MHAWVVSVFQVYATPWKFSLLDTLSRISVDLDNFPLPFSLPLLDKKECAAKGGAEERSIREPDHCLLQP